MAYNSALYGVMTWILRKEVRERLKGFEMWIRMMMEKLRSIGKMRIEDVLERVRKKRKELEIIRKVNIISLYK